MRRLHEKFVNEYVKIYLQGKPNGTKAARNAGYKATTAAVQACRLLRRDNIRAAIDEKLADIAARSEVTPDSIVRALEEIAYGKDDSGSYSHRTQVRLRALELLGKAESMFSERVIHVPEVPTLSPEEVEALRAQSAALDGVMRIHSRVVGPTGDGTALPNSESADDGE